MLSREVTILLYHHVGRPPASPTAMRGLYVTARHLAWQIRQLQRLPVRFVTCRDLVGATEHDADPRHWIMMTFDDGTRGVFDEAFPVLQRSGASAMVFPIAMDIGKTGVVWGHASDKTPHDMLSTDQIRELADAGLEFGSHLCHHVRAPELSSQDLRTELSESKRILEALVGRAILSVAYPYGHYSPAVTNAARAAGYRFGLTTQRGTNRGRDEMALCRIPAKGTRWHHYLYFWQLLRTLARPGNTV